MRLRVPFSSFVPLVAPGRAQVSLRNGRVGASDRAALGKFYQQAFGLHVSPCCRSVAVCVRGAPRTETVTSAYRSNRREVLR